MSNAKIWYFTGKVGWLSADRPDKFDNYSIQVYLDDESWERFSRSGLQLRPKTDDLGQSVTFRRAKEKQKADGTVMTFDPPELLDADLEPIANAGTIGKGSDVTVKVTVYPTKVGTGHFLEAIRVDELVERQSGPEMAEEFESAF